MNASDIPPPHVGQLLTTEAAALRLALSRSYLEKLRQEDRGPIFMRIGRAVRYRLDDLDLWVASHIGGGQ